uniref:Uncharacterized protein n=1 Tax=Quercus lobata TaxID=97700 RepID=A0A7N2RA80_QUELO
MGRIFIGGFQLRLWLLDVHKHFCQSDCKSGHCRSHDSSFVLLEESAGNIQGEYVNLGAYYLVESPVGAALVFLVCPTSFGLDLERGPIVKAFLVARGTSFTNWRKTIISTKKIFLSR